MPLNYATSVITAWKTTNADETFDSVDALLDAAVASFMIDNLAQEVAAV